MNWFLKIAIGLTVLPLVVCAFTGGGALVGTWATAVTVFLAIGFTRE